MAEVRVKAAAVEEVKNHPVAAEVKQKPVKQDTRSRRLPVSPMRGVDSTYRRYGESTPHIGDTGSRNLKIKLV
jgi:hypothetical protein